MKPKCPTCGFKMLRNGFQNGAQRYVCRNCQKTSGDHSDVNRDLEAKHSEFRMLKMVEMAMLPRNEKEYPTPEDEPPQVQLLRKEPSLLKAHLFYSRLCEKIRDKEEAKRKKQAEEAASDIGAEAAIALCDRWLRENAVKPVQ